MNSYTFLPTHDWRDAPRRRREALDDVSDHPIGGIVGAREPRARVLVVEDERDILEAACESLRDEGYAAVAATTLADARRELSAGHVDAIILDLRLPDGNGAELLAELAATGARVSVVVASVALDVPAVAEQYGVRFVRKPFHTDLLVTLIDLSIERGTYPRLR